MLACVASVSDRVIARKLERKRKKKKGVRGRGEEETLARKPHYSDPPPPLDISRFVSFVN